VCLLLVLTLASVGNAVFIVADNYFLRGQFPATDEDPIVLTKTAISLNPYNDIYRSMLGKAYESQMLAWLKQASTDSAAGQDSAPALQQARAAFTSAEQTFKETIAIVPTEYDNYLFLSSLYNEVGSYLDPKYFADAIRTADAGIAVEPYGPGVRLQKAVAQSASGDRAGALATAEAAVNMDPRYVDIHLFYAQTLTEAGRLKDAADQYRQLVELDPANTAYSDALKAVEASLTASGQTTATP
jgi:tetratricopeptide (TPR) repeat protein